MGRIVATADVHNAAEPRKGRKVDLLVDTGASHVVLPSAWKEQFGEFEVEEEIRTALANQDAAEAIVCGPARIHIEGFRVVHSEVVFLDMGTHEGRFEPLLGYIPLEQCGAAVDMIGHRLVPVGYLDMKATRPPSAR